MRRGVTPVQQSRSPQSGTASKQNRKGQGARHHQTPSPIPAAKTRRRGIVPRSARAGEKRESRSPNKSPLQSGTVSIEAGEAAQEFAHQVRELRALVAERPTLLSSEEGVSLGVAVVSGLYAPASSGEGVEASQSLGPSEKEERHGRIITRIVSVDPGQLERLLFLGTLYLRDRYRGDAPDSSTKKSRSPFERYAHWLADAKPEPDQKPLTLLLFQLPHGDPQSAVAAVKALVTAAGGNIVSHPGLPQPFIVSQDPLAISELRYLLFDSRGWTLIERGDIRLFQTAPGWRALSRLVRLRRWMLQWFTAEERERCMVIGSMVLFMYGIRLPGDIDLYVHNPEGDREFVQKFERAMQKEGELFSSVDVILRGFGKWVIEGGGEYVEALVDNYFFAWPASFGAKDMSTVISDSQFYSYSLGVKSVSIAGDIARRIRRIRPAAYADLIALERGGKFRGLFDVVIPKMTDYIFEENQWRYLSSEERPRFLETVRLYLKSRFGVTASVVEIQELIDRGPSVDPFRYPSGEKLERLEGERFRENNRRADARDAAAVSEESSGLSVAPKEVPVIPQSGPTNESANRGLRLRSIGGRGTVTVVTRVFG